jgi:hypothetical protein
MSDKLVRSLYEARLKTWADARVPALPIAFENVTFTPPVSAYLRAFILRAPTGSLDLAGAMKNRLGIFQVNIVCPIGNGPGSAETIAAELETLFTNNLRLTNGGFTVQSTSPLRVGPALVDDRYTVPVDFTYRADET